MAFFGSEGPLERELARLQKETREKDALLVSEETRYVAKCKELHEAHLQRDEALYRLQHEAERAAAAEASLDKRLEELKQWQIKGHQMESAVDQANKTIKELERDNHKAQSDFDAVASFTSAERVVLEKKVTQLETALRGKDVEIAEARSSHLAIERKRFGYESTNIQHEAPDMSKVVELEGEVASLREKLVAATQDRRTSMLSSSVGSSRPRSSIGFAGAASGIPISSSRIPAPATSGSGPSKRRRSSSFSGNSANTGATAAVARLERDLAETRSNLVTTETELVATKTKLSKAENELLKAENQLMALERSHKVELNTLKSKLEDVGDEVMAARTNADERVAAIKEDAALREKATVDALAGVQQKLNAAELEFKALQREATRLESERDELAQQSTRAGLEDAALRQRVAELEGTISAHQEQVETAKAQLMTGQSEISWALERVSSLEASLAEATSASAAASKKALDLQSQLAEAQVALAAASDDAEVIKLRASVAELEVQVHHATSSLDNASKRVAEAENNVAARTAEAAALRADVQRLETERQTLSTAEVDLARERDAHSAAQAELSKITARLRADLESSKTEVDTLRSTKDAATACLVIAESELEAARHALEHRAVELATITATCEDLRTRCADTSNAYDLAAGRIGELESSLAALTAAPKRSFDDEEVHSLRVKYAAAEAFLAELGTTVEETKESLHASEEKVKSLEALEWGATRGRDDALAKVTELEATLAMLTREHEEATLSLQRRLAAADDRFSAIQIEHQRALGAVVDSCTAAELRASSLEAAASSQAAETAAYEARVGALSALVGDLEKQTAGHQSGRDAAMAELGVNAAKLATCEDDLRRSQEVAQVQEARLNELEGQLVEANKVKQDVKNELEGRLKLAESARLEDNQALQSRIHSLNAKVDSLEGQVSAAPLQVDDALAKKHKADVETLGAQLEQASLLISRLREEKAALSDALGFTIHERDAAATAHAEALATAQTSVAALQLQTSTAEDTLQSALVACLQQRADSRQHIAELRSLWHAARAQRDGAVSSLALTRMNGATAEARHAELVASRDSAQRALIDSQEALDQAVSESMRLKTEVETLRSAPNASDQSQMLVALRIEVGTLEARVQRRMKLVTSQQLAISQLETNLLLNREEVGRLSNELAGSRDEGEKLRLELETRQRESEDLVKAREGSLCQLARAEALVSRAAAEKASVEAQLQQAVDDLSVSHRSLEVAEERAKTLQGELAAQRADLTAALAESTLVSTQVASLQQMAMGLGTSNAELAGRVQELKQELDDLRASRASLSAALDNADKHSTAETEGLRGQLRDAERALGEARAQAAQSLAEQDEVTRQIAGHQSQADRLRADVEDRDQDVRRLAAEVANGAAALEASMSEIKAADGRLTDLQTELDDAKVRAAKLEAELQAAEKERSSLTSSLETAHNEATNLQGRLDKSERQVAEYAQHTSDARAAAESARATAEQAKEDRTRQDLEDRASAATQIASLQAELAATRQQQSALETEIQERRTDHACAQGVIETQTRELEQLKHELETLVEDFNGCTAELERMEGELKVKGESETRLIEQLTRSENLATKARENTEQLDTERRQVELKADELASAIREKDSAIAKLMSEASASARASEAARAVADAAQERVRELESQLETKTVEVGDAEDQLLYQLKENKRALNQIQKLKDRVHSLQRPTGDASPVEVVASSQPPSAAAAAAPSSESRKRKLESISRSTAAPGVPASPRAPSSQPRPASRPAGAGASSRSKAVLVHPDAGASSSSHVESQEELKPPGPDESYAAARQPPPPRQVLRERHPNAHAEVIPVTAAAAQKPGAAVAEKKKKNNEGKQPAVQGQGGGGGKSTADLLASIQALRKKQQAASQAAGGQSAAAAAAV